MTQHEQPVWTIVAELNGEGDIGLRVYHRSMLADHAADVDKRDDRAVQHVLEDEAWGTYVALAVLLLRAKTGADPDPDDFEIFVPPFGEGDFDADDWEMSFGCVYLGVCAAVIVQDTIDDPETYEEGDDDEEDNVAH